MKFWRKFWLLLILAGLFAVLQFSTSEIGHLEFSIANRNFSIGLYAILMMLDVIWLISFSIKSFFIWFVSLFFRNKTAEETKSINGLANLIVSDDFDFLQNFEKTFTTENMQILKIALAVKRGLNKHFEKTGLHCIDIYLIKSELTSFIKNSNIISAIDLANKVIKSYYENISVVCYEILEIAKLAKKNSFNFTFEPEKFKYNLPKTFIDQYYCELGLLEFDLQPNVEKRLKIIEKLHKSYPASFNVLKSYLDIAFENNVEEKRILQAIKETLEINPNRQIADYLFRINRKDIFEIVQSYLINIKDNNLEKIWTLLLLSTKLCYLHIAKELISKIIEIDKSDELYKFYIKHYTELSKEESIVSLITESIK